MFMNNETELARLTKENDNFRKIIEAQQKTILRLVDYFILEAEKNTEENAL
ncbi:MAG: adenylate kinase [Roseburia sp.]|nr:adenylate kinase [Roseburia sp.]